jgi:elongation factor P
MNIPVKKGMLLRHQGHLYYVEQIVEHHSGQQRPAIHVSLREVKDGRHIERTVDELTPIEEVAGAYRPLQYLYAKAGVCVFMDEESFEEVELSGEALGGFEPFLKEGDEYRVLYADERPLRVDVPDTVVAKVADTAAPSHAVGGASSILKEARLDNGLMVRVPLFIKTGDPIKLNSRSREYIGKAQGEK